MTGAAVTVTDRATYSAVVSPEQAVAYVRRMLPKWKERTEAHYVCFDPPDITDDMIAVQSGGAGFARDVAFLCDDIVRLGLAAQPSEVLRAMAQEEAGK